MGFLRRLRRRLGKVRNFEVLADRPEIVFYIFFVEVKEKGAWTRKLIPLNGYYLTIFLLTMTTCTGSSVRIKF